MMDRFTSLFALVHQFEQGEIESTSRAQLEAQRKKARKDKKEEEKARLKYE